jgi:hypothetical protein
MVAYFDGKPMPRFDYRDIRKKGTLIKKTGGKAPGPGRLIEAHANIIAVLDQAIGRQLTTLEAHDIACYEAACVTDGGIREAAMISLFDKDDQEMLTCKSMFDATYVSHVEDEKERIVTITTTQNNQTTKQPAGRSDPFSTTSEGGAVAGSTVHTYTRGGSVRLTTRANHPARISVSRIARSVFMVRRLSSVCGALGAGGFRRTPGTTAQCPSHNTRGTTGIRLRPANPARRGRYSHPRNGRSIANGFAELHMPGTCHQSRLRSRRART